MTNTLDYLDTETISNAAELVNSTLISKAYMDRELKFVSINWDELLKNQVNDLKVTEEIYNNDKNNLNIIYSLLQALDRGKEQHRSFNTIITQKDAKISSLTKKIEALEQQLEETDAKLSSAIRINKNELTKKVQDLSHFNKLQAQDLNKLKNWSNDVKTKFQVEIKKKNLEIDQLKNKLLDKRNLSSTITYGIPLASNVSSPTTEDQNINSNIIYNNNPIIDNSYSFNVNKKTLNPILNQEYEDIVSNLTEVIESLAAENYKFATLIKLVNEYYLNLNTQISNILYRNMTIENLANPSDSIDLTKIANIDKSSTEKYFDEMETFESVTKPVLNSIYRNYHNISALVQLLDPTNFKDSEYSDSKKISQLTNELEITKKNWQDALNTLESWKKYQRLGPSESIEK